jgi:hypothetical protein
MILSQRPENANDCIGEWPTKKNICITILLMKIPSTTPTPTMGGGGNTRVMGKTHEMERCIAPPMP